MKAVLSLVILFAGVNVFAQTCYTLKPNPIANESIPSMICLDAIKYDFETGALTVYSTTNSDLFNNLKIDSINRRYSFVVASVLKDEQAPYACGEVEKVTLKIAGNVASGEADLKDLMITIDQQITKDECHLELREHEFSYELQQ